MAVHACLSRHISTFLLPATSPLIAAKDKEGKEPREIEVLAQIEFNNRVNDNWLTKCWGTKLECQFNLDAPQRTLAKTTGDIFEKVIVRLFASFNTNPFAYEKIKDSIEFFFLRYQENASPLARIVSTIFTLGGHPNDQAKLAKKILQIVFTQHLFDPVEYVSHGFDHSLNVADYCVDIINNNPSVRNKFLARYKLDHNDPRLIPLVRVMAYLHDCGYPCLKGREKANHSVYSADQVDKIKESLQQVLGNGERFDKLFGDMREAIFYHNADEGPGTCRGRLPTNSGCFLLNPVDRQIVEKVFDHPEVGIRPRRHYSGGYQGYSETQAAPWPCRKLDLHYPGDKKLGLERKPAILDDNPFHIIRIADNLDFARSRMTPFQHSLDFTTLYRKRYRIGEIDDLLKKSPPNADVLEAEKATLKTDCAVLTQNNESLKKIDAKINKESFKHFGGCEAVLEVKEIIFGSGVSRVKVNVDEVKWKELAKVDFKDSKATFPVNIAIYQMFRAFKAFEWVFIDGNKKSLAQGLVFDIRAGDEELTPYFPKIKYHIY